jgi:hypothetical protein
MTKTVYNPTEGRMFLINLVGKKVGADDPAGGGQEHKFVASKKRRYTFDTPSISFYFYAVCMLILAAPQPDVRGYDRYECI